MAIIGLALLLTLPLPITVGLIGNLDWGPVVGGYLAALLMAGAYAPSGCSSPRAPTTRSWP
jgi:ABC-2 type transport system permease protein